MGGDPCPEEIPNMEIIHWAATIGCVCLDESGAFGHHEKPTAKHPFCRLENNLEDETSRT